MGQGLEMIVILLNYRLCDGFFLWGQDLFYKYKQVVFYKGLFQGSWKVYRGVVVFEIFMISCVLKFIRNLC